MILFFLSGLVGPTRDIYQAIGWALVRAMLKEASKDK